MSVELVLEGDVIALFDSTAEALRAVRIRACPHHRGPLPDVHAELREGDVVHARWTTNGWVSEGDAAPISSAGGAA